MRLLFLQNIDCHYDPTNHFWYGNILWVIPERVYSENLEKEIILMELMIPYFHAGSERDKLENNGLVVKALDSQSRGPGSKPLGGSKDDLAFHPSEVGKMSTRSLWKLTGKK